MQAPRGGALQCLGWRQEAALRLLRHYLEQQPSAAEIPSLLARLPSLADDETLVVRGAKLSQRLRTHEEAPRLVWLEEGGDSARQWRTPARMPDRWARAWLAKWTLGSRLHTGLQGALAAAYEVFGAIARRRFDGTLTGRLVVCSGLGTSGTVLAAAAAAQGAAFLGIEVEAESIKKCMRANGCEIMVTRLEEAVRILRHAVYERKPAAVAVIGNAAELLSEMARRGIVPDLLSDGTPAHEPLDGYIPVGLSKEQARSLQAAAPQDYRRRAEASLAMQLEAIVALQGYGSLVLNWCNGLWDRAEAWGIRPRGPVLHVWSDCLAPELSRDREPVRWAALSGEASDLAAMDAALCEPAEEATPLRAWVRQAVRRCRQQGLPTRVAWLHSDARRRLVETTERMVREGRLDAPVVFAFDGWDEDASVEQAFTEQDIATALEAAQGAAWVELTAGVPFGLGRVRGGGLTLVAEGTRESARRAERLLEPAQPWRQVAAPGPKR